MKWSYPDQVSFLHLPTPLHRLPRLEKQLGIELWIKRDDCTDLVVSGNKARRLEFLLADALAQRADTLIAVGARAQTNLSRVVTYAGARFGLKTQLLLGTADPARPPPLEGNLLLSVLGGAQIRWFETKDVLAQSELLARQAADEIVRQGGRPYVIPLSAANALGLWAYVKVVEEITQQLPKGGPVTIVYPVASGGTAAGIVLGIKLFGLQARGLGVLIGASDEATARRWMRGYMEPNRIKYGWDDALCAEQGEFIDGSGAGLGVSRPEELSLIKELAATEGIAIEPVYVAKAFRKLCELAHQPGRPLGDRVIFIHTGGAYGLLPIASELLALR